MKTLLVSLACVVLLGGCAAKSADHMNWHERRQAEFTEKANSNSTFDWNSIADAVGNALDMKFIGVSK